MNHVFWESRNFLSQAALASSSYLESSSKESFLRNSFSGNVYSFPSQWLISANNEHYFHESKSVTGDNPNTPNWGRTFHAGVSGWCNGSFLHQEGSAGLWDELRRCTTVYINPVQLLIPSKMERTYTKSAFWIKVEEPPPIPENQKQYYSMGFLFSNSWLNNELTEFKSVVGSWRWKDCHLS